MLLSKIAKSTPIVNFQNPDRRSFCYLCHSHLCKIIDNRDISGLSTIAYELFKQWGNLELRGAVIASAVLPITFREFFSGCATWNNPQSASENVAGADFTLAVKAATNTVTIGVNKKLTNLGVRYIVIGNAD